MLAWIAVGALAEVPEPWKPALQTPPEWIVRSGTIWLRDGEDCFPTRAEDAAHLLLVARLCEVRSKDGGDDLVCDQRFQLERGWQWVDQRCRIGLLGPAGTRSTDGGPPPAVLAIADAASAAWSPRVDLAPVMARPMIEQRPCDGASLAELTKQAKKEAGKEQDAQTAWLAARGITDGVRRCEVSDGVKLEPVVAGRSRTVTPGTRTGTAAVDCRVACAAAPALAQLEAASAEVEGRAFWDAGAPTLRLYADKAACLASPPAEPHVPRDLCTTLGADLAAQAKGK